MLLRSINSLNSVVHTVNAYVMCSTAHILPNSKEKNNSLQLSSQHKYTIFLWWRFILRNFFHFLKTIFSSEKLFLFLTHKHNWRYFFYLFTLCQMRIFWCIFFFWLLIQIKHLPERHTERSHKCSSGHFRFLRLNVGTCARHVKRW